ncbi:hypothetical protein [Microbulbifer rhizosphaerae]|uniref:Uncharacterized protein n=1 Tax=Microbulbifer rhizosphaerae TaxID=1562603 RepID=A0A7W4WED2_9GAMM|nr:hypothetical protein [Microbulbifer rhizosphaerae]MBB3062108.1 hypothetical protein [Microbulbifer rhizosphaerae]
MPERLPRSCESELKISIAVFISGREALVIAASLHVTGDIPNLLSFNRARLRLHRIAQQQRLKNKK